MMEYLDLDERCRVLRKLLKNRDSTHFIIPKENAHTYRTELYESGGDVVAVDLSYYIPLTDDRHAIELGTTPFTSSFNFRNEYLAAAGYKTFESAFLAMTGRFIPNGRGNQIHRHLIVHREHLDTLLARYELARVKRKLYS